LNPETENSNQLSDVKHHLDQAYFYYEETEEFEKALLECDIVLKIAPYFVEVHNLRGIILEAAHLEGTEQRREFRLPMK
jgi:hypothetical protein